MFNPKRIQRGATAWKPQSTEFSGKWNRPIGLNEKTGKTREDRNGGPENSGRKKREAPGSGHKKSAFRKDAKKKETWNRTAVRLSQFPHQPKTTNLNEP